SCCQRYKFKAAIDRFFDSRLNCGPLPIAAARQRPTSFERGSSFPKLSEEIAMNDQEQTVSRLEREVGVALERRDLNTLRRLFADDFVGINPIGAEVAKADVLAQIGSSDYEPESIVNDVRRVRVYGNVAVVT